MTTALFLLRAKQLGLTLAELSEMSEGMVTDMFIESGNDTVKDGYVELATQADFDAF